MTRGTQVKILALGIPAMLLAYWLWPVPKSNDAPPMICDAGPEDTALRTEALAVRSEYKRTKGLLDEKCWSFTADVALMAVIAARMKK